MKSVLVSRAVGQASSLAKALTEAGFEPIERPSIEIHAIPGSLPDLSSEWVVFTSRNGLATFVELGGIVAQGQKAVVASSSERSQNFIKLARPDSQGIRAFFECVAPTTITLLRGNLATSALPEDLVAQGHKVIDARIYETKFAAWESPLPALWGAAFTSKSCVDSVVVNASSLGQLELIQSCKRFAMGSMTSQALDDHRLPATATCDEPSIPNLVELIAREAQIA